MSLPYVMMLKATMEAGDHIFEWRNKMAQTAMFTVESLFAELDLAEPKAIADLVEALLGPDEKSSCFYYRIPFNGNETPKVTYW